MKVPWFERLAITLLKKHIEKVEGLENLPVNKPYILAPNHQSNLDPVLLWVGIVPRLNEIMYSLSKPQLKKYYGKFGEKYLGMMYIDPNDKAKVLEKALEHIKKNDVVCIFPEGGRNYDPLNLARGKTGAVRLALAGQVPIIPVGMSVPPGKYVFESIKNAIFSKIKSWIKIGRPIYFNDYYHRETTKELLDELTKKVMLEIGRLCGKKYPY